MKATLLLVVALAAMVCANVSCTGRKVEIPEPSIGVVEPLRDLYQNEKAKREQAACVARVPQDCRLQVDAFLRIANVQMFTQNAEEDITYHNDNVGGEDGSVHLNLKEGMLTAKTNPFEQHTHGKAHTLFVLTKERVDNQCVDRLRAYPLQTGDEVRFFHDAMNAPIDWIAILGGARTPDVRIKRLTKTGAKVAGCSNEDSHSTSEFFQIEAPAMAANGQLKNNPNITPASSDPNLQIRQFATTANTKIRRIVVQNPNSGLRHYIKLGGCSAWSICTRPVDEPSCERVPLCALRLTAPCNCDGAP